MDETNASSAHACSEESCCKAKCCWLWGLFGAAASVGIFMALWAAVSDLRTHNQIAGPPLLKADGKDLRATVISPVIEATIQPGKNVLWCSTFQLVWNEACRYAGGDIHLKDEPPIVAALNKKLGDEKDVDGDSCVVMSGLAKDGIVGKIRQELDRKFHGQADPDLFDAAVPRLPPDGWVGYAYMFRDLPFEYPFSRLGAPLYFGSTRVTSFGLKDVTCRLDDAHKAAQVVIWDYKDASDFVLELRPKNQGERIVLAKVSPAKTLRETVDAVRSRMAGVQSKGHLGMEESVVIPLLNFDLSQENCELYGKPITTPGPLKATPIILALQDVRFRLDERGAILKSEAIQVKSGCGPGPPRQFIFDKPFLILLERKDAKRPYFALWVDNAELLVPFK
jgi:hypothetical protein